MDGVADMRRAADDLEGFGEAPQDGSQRKGIERRANVIVMTQVGGEVTHGADGPDQRNEADDDLRDRARQAKLVCEIAKEQPGADIANEGAPTRRTANNRRGL